MRRDLGRLQISKVIVHDIPRRHKSVGDADPPVMSEIESALNPQLRLFFQDRIKKSLGTAAFDVVFDPASPSLTPSLVSDQLAKQGIKFVPMSQQLAQHLYDSQTGVNSAGILTIVEASIERCQALAILKLEREAGLSLQRSEHNGLATFDIEHLSSLMLTEKTKIFKAGLFVQEGGTLETIEGLVSDLQRGSWRKSEVASFFLTGFLGCRLREHPEVTTKRFFTETMDFINREVDDPMLKTRYAFAVVSAMNDNANVINPVSFADQHLEVRDRQPLLDHLANRSIPDRPIPKDTSLIVSHLRRTRWDFESGLALLGPPDSFKEHVTTSDLGDGRIKTEITDALAKVNGR
jgi:hypothetical protein